jgi:hypothetical protein
MLLSHVAADQRHKKQVQRDRNEERDPPRSRHLRYRPRFRSFPVREDL